MGGEGSTALLRLLVSPATGGGVDSGGPFALTVLSLPQEASLLTLKQNQQWIFLETLAPDTAYELQVRVRAQRGSLLTWSPWSQPLAFRTRPEDQLLAGRRPDGTMELDRTGCGSWTAVEGGLGLRLQCSAAIISSLDVTLQCEQRGHNCAHFTDGNRDSGRTRGCELVGRPERLFSLSPS